MPMVVVVPIVEVGAIAAIVVCFAMTCLKKV